MASPGPASEFIQASSGQSMFGQADFREARTHDDPSIFPEDVERLSAASTGARFSAAIGADQGLGKMLL